MTVTQIDNGNAVVNGWRTTGTSFTPRAKLTVGKSYRWQVQSVSSSGRVGPGLLPASQPTFTVVDSTTTPGATPEPVTPAGSTSVRFPTLQWTPVTSATRYLIYVRPVGTVLWTAVNDQFEYAAGEDRGTSWLAPDSYEWRVEAYNGATLLSTTQNSSTFVISSLTSVTGQRVALSGVASESPATSCSNALNPSLPLADQQCMGLGATPVLTWDAQPNAGRYIVWISRDQQLTNWIAKYPTEQETFTPPTALFDSQAGSAFYWHVQPCKVAGILQAPRARGSRLQQALEAGAAAVAGRRVDGVERRDVHVARLPGDQPGRDHAREPRRCVLRGAGRRGDDVPGPGRQRAELPVATGDDGGRPDHLHGIRRHLSRGPALLAGAGDRRVRSTRSRGARRGPSPSGRPRHADGPDEQRADERHRSRFAGSRWPTPRATTSRCTRTPTRSARPATSCSLATASRSR